MMQSLALHPLHRDKIRKTDWSKTEIRPILALRCIVMAMKEAHRGYNTIPKCDA